MTRHRRLVFLVPLVALVLGPPGAGADTLVGHVKSADTPLAGVEIWLSDQWGNPYPSTATTGADGSYSLNLPAGTYFARTRNDLGYVDECYDDVLHPWSYGVCGPWGGTPFTVAGTKTLDFELDLGGRIHGSVKDADTGQGIPKIDVSYQSLTTEVVYSEYTTSWDGTWTMRMALPLDQYRIYTENYSGYINQLYDNGTPVTVTAGSTTTIGFTLERGAHLVGRVTDAETGEPVPYASAWVGIVDAANQLVGRGPAETNGVYATSGVPPGDYYVKVRAYDGYLSEVYDDRNCAWPCSDLSGATLVSLSEREIRTIDFQLERPNDRDGDGIADPVDRNAVTGVSEETVWSNDFNTVGVGGTTNGSLTSRGGFDVKVRADSRLALVSVTGAGAPATVDSCAAWGPEGVTLDASGELVRLACDPSTGSTTATALATPDAIELRAPPSGPGVEVLLPQGFTATVGSPVTAGPDNPGPIDVRIRDAANAVVGTFQLDAKEKVDVSVSPQGSVTVAVISGSVDVTVRGVTQTLEDGQAETFHPTPDQVLAPLPAQVDAFLASGDIRRSATASTIKSQIATARKHLAAGRTHAAISVLGGLLKYLDARVRAGQIKPRVRDTLAPDIRLAIRLTLGRWIAHRGRSRAAPPPSPRRDRRAG